MKVYIFRSKMRKKANLLKILGLSALLSLPSVSARPLEQRVINTAVTGQVTDASTLDNVGIPGLTVSAGELGDDVTDEQGNYQISSNAVAPVYELVNYRGKEIQIFNVNGQLVDRLVPNAGQFHWNSNAAKGVYFASDNNNVYPFVNNNGAWINMPQEKRVGGKVESLGNGGKEGNRRISNVYTFTVDGHVDVNNPAGQGWGGYGLYHTFSREVRRSEEH